MRSVTLRPSSNGLKKTTSLCWGLALLLICFAPPASGQDEGFESLLFEEIPSVFTASKKDESIDRATAVVTVITAEDIRTSGARTLYEVLKRVPGFFPSSQATWTLTATRGLTSDGNDHVLLLVDGHVQNSIVGQGYQQQDMLPVLEKVAKVEIIRGPGSVLWGSSAVLGIINIITRDDAVESTTANLAYGARDGMMNANIVRSIGTPGAGANGLISFSFWKSEGYGRPDKKGSGGVFSKEEADQVQGNVEFPWGQVGDWPDIDQHKDGWELYSKIKFGGDHEIVARIVESRVVYPWDTWLDNPGSDLRMRKTYLSYRHFKELNQKVTVHSTLHGDMLLQNRFPEYSELFKQGSGEQRAAMQDQSNEERAFGAELMADIQFSPTHQATFGVKGVHAVIGPNRDSFFDIANNTPSEGDIPYIGVESGPDNTLGIYFEDKLDINSSKTTLFFGSRVEYNDFRDKDTTLLPRGGVIHSFTDQWTGKYVYNSGYLRPNAAYSKTTGIIRDDTRGPHQEILVVTESERIQNHEAQFYWNGGRQHASLNVFHMTVDNYISFDANNLPQGYKNLGTATTRGVEMEGSRRLDDRWSLQGTYAYALAKLDDDTHQGAVTDGQNESLNYPRHTYNLGLTWVSPRGHAVDINLNGWRDMSIVLPLNTEGTGGQFSNLEGESYLDINYNVPQFLGSSLDLSTYCMNAFDNTDAVGMIINNGVWYPRGRNIGTSLSYRW